MIAVSPFHFIAPVFVVLLAVLARVERKLVAGLREAGAVSPETAVPLGEPRGIRAMQLQRLMDGGAVIALPDNRYFVDEEGLRQYRHERRRRAASMIVVVALAGAIVFLFAR